MRPAVHERGTQPFRAWSGRASLPALFALLVAGACTSAPNAPEVSAAVINGEYRAAIEGRTGSYRIQPGDVLSIDIDTPGEADLDQEEVIVRPDGRGDVFFMPDYALAGKTVAEVREDLEPRLRVHFRDAVVSVQVHPTLEQVYLVGQFVEPQILELTPDMTLREAVSAAGGTKVTASSALLKRAHDDPEHPVVYRIELEDESGDLVLLPGDEIILPRTWFATFGTYFQEYVLSLIDLRLVFGKRVDV